MPSKFAKFINQVKHTFKKAQPSLGKLAKLASNVDVPAGLANVAKISNNLAPVLAQVKPSLGREAQRLSAQAGKASNITGQGIQAFKTSSPKPVIPPVQEQPVSPAVFNEPASSVVQFS